MTEPRMPRSQQLLTRLHDRMTALGGPEVAGADYEDVRRALATIEAEAAASVRAELREVLRRYGHHDPNCLAPSGFADCRCGFSAAILDAATEPSSSTGVPSPRDPAPDVPPVPGPGRPTS